MVYQRRGISERGGTTTAFSTARKNPDPPRRDLEPVPWNLSSAFYTIMKRKPFWKYFVVFLVLFGAFLGAMFGLGFVKFNQIQGFIKLSKSGAFEPPPTAVTTEIAKKTDWEPRMDSVGSLAAVNGSPFQTGLHPIGLTPLGIPLAS